MSLKGLSVVAFEARHAKTLADLIAKQGGEPFSAPAMKEVPIENNPDALGFADKLFKGKIDLLVLLTGVGTRALADVLETRWPREKFMEALKKTVIVPRGPKPIRVLREWNVPFALTVPEPNTWRELLKSLDENPDAVNGAKGKAPLLSGKTVAVQEYGVTNEEFLEGLRFRGADVLRVPVYRWALPDDEEPIREAIRRIVEGKADVVMFTTAVQIAHMFEVFDTMPAGAHRRGPLVEAFKKVAVASVGPDCSEALRSFGIEPDIEPESPKMGPLVVETAAKARAVLDKKRGRESCSQDVIASVLSLASASIEESIFMKACRHEKTRVTPVWFMRQAGRYMQEYRELREKHPFLELCKDPALASEITVHAQKTLGVDAAILFSDILILIEPMGLSLEFVKGDGPSIANPLATSADVDHLRIVDPQKTLPFVMEAARRSRERLPAGIPLIGFAAAPFTLASYMIEGGSTTLFKKTRQFMKEDWMRWDVLMRKVVDSTAKYLLAQVEAGCQVLQLFDSWAGALEEGEYRHYAMPFTKSLIQRLGKKTPVIHFGTKTGPFIESFAEAGGDVIGVDQRISLSEAWARIGDARGIQGNMDPRFLLQGGAAMEAEVQKILEQARGRPGHIFNLGHGVQPETPVENVKALVEMVHRWSSKL
jgi:uroporphyrinogen decarboxylase